MRINGRKNGINGKLALSDIALLRPTKTTFVRYKTTSSYVPLYLVWLLYFVLIYRGTCAVSSLLRLPSHQA